jgi:membrane peptidoglycan carboxypeptidase
MGGMCLAVALISHEVRSSWIQSRVLVAWNARLSHWVEPGASAEIVFPSGGPWDRGRGYSEVPRFQERLLERGYVVREQARFSPWLQRLAGWGIAPPVRKPAIAGLQIRGEEDVLYDARAKVPQFETFEEIPREVLTALLYMENHRLGDPSDPRNNPAVDWPRLGKAGLSYLGHQLGLPVRIEGGSTLAVQMEKYRHSPGGRTDSPLDKLRQITAGSLKAYRDGPDTRQRRQQIVLDYLNTVPMAAAPGYGEAHGLGEGLYAWFGMDLKDVSRSLDPEVRIEAKALALKHVLALLCAIPAPSRYLLVDRSALEARVERYARLLVRDGHLEPTLYEALVATPLHFLPSAPGPRSAPHDKISRLLRTDLLSLLGLPGTYELDRLDLDVETTIDTVLQREVDHLFRNLRRPDFAGTQGLVGPRLLGGEHPEEVTYSLVLYERTPHGNLLRVQADSLDEPFDTARGMKMELGSTAKLRTLVHYLELVAELHEHLGRMDREALAAESARAGDPITRWAVQNFASNPGTDLDTLLERALQRAYSAHPGEMFFTGGGRHTFRNFDSRENGRVMTVREAAVRSTNLVFIRLMRDLVAYHRARLPYDADGVLRRLDHPRRGAALRKAADRESVEVLSGFHRRLRDRSPGELVDRLLERRTDSRARGLTLLFFAWNPEAGAAELAAWLEDHDSAPSPEVLERLVRNYGRPDFDLADYAYLLRRHPLEVWCAGRLIDEPGASWEEILAESGDARRVASAWLFRTRHRTAQDLRLRIQAERDAFDRMVPYWRKLGFPFEELVPSYATAIGSSSDRPVALAELMGIILNDGVRRPVVSINRIGFGLNTPYHSLYERKPEAGTRVMNEAVARSVRSVLVEAVDSGTGRRIAGAFMADDRPIPAGGKTGSGDNRRKLVNRRAEVIDSEALNRTATFAFHIGDRYFGAVVAYVAGPAADRHAFTSALPVAVLRLLAPSINERLASGPPAEHAWVEPNLTVADG